ncbi:hypothetical protein SAY87_031905 [Trapa incisa]|uniref:PH domain-containing protein n=1 Tax=Trapa incisa TaxID=236973 RepID=A0AAN7KLC5_9MYRT|nr:hypothetical protein SAY87_031905 [Trapa incisa]
MRVKEMHPLCCIPLESHNIGDASPEASAPLSRARSVPVELLDFSSGSDGNAGYPPVRSDCTFAGVLYKWTNYSKGWRSRWFLLLRNGVLTYSKIRRSDRLNLLPPNDDVRLIGDISSSKFSRVNSESCTRNHRRTIGIVQHKISSFRESKSDDRRFYVFTATKTLHLRTDSKRDRVAWIQALVSSISILSSRSLRDPFSCIPPKITISTEKLKTRLAQEGVGEKAVKDCEYIMLSEFSDIQGQLKLLSEERSSLVNTLRQLLSTNLEAETLGVHDSDQYLLLKHEFPGSGHEKYSECSSTESSDDIEKQQSDEISDEDDTYFFDAKDHFFYPSFNCGDVMRNVNEINVQKAIFIQHDSIEKMGNPKGVCDTENLTFERRKKLPDPVEKEKGVSLWSMIKDSVGKDLTRVCLPVYFNEPLSSLQKCFEDLEYSHILDQAYKDGKAGNNILRALKVAAFAISGYASSKGRHCKPFNPLLGETYEADFPEKGIRFFSEKVSHHPTVVACHCEGRGWKFWADSNLRTKFWGQSIQLDPVGDLILEFEDGEVFKWSKVTTTIYNLILGKVYCDHHGTMQISGNHQYSCNIKFKEPSIFERNPHQVHGFVEDVTGRKIATLFGKWDESIYYMDGEVNSRPKDLSASTNNAHLLWKSNKPPNLTRYNLTSFAITLNEMTPGLQEKLPPTDSRLRPDQRHLENGEYEKANSEKQRLEKRQRLSRKLQESGWKPRWFQQDGENGPYRYMGGYWEAREQKVWDGCPDIFGEFTVDISDTAEGSR